VIQKSVRRRKVELLRVIKT